MNFLIKKEMDSDSEYSSEKEDINQNIPHPGWKC